MCYTQKKNGLVFVNVAVTAYILAGVGGAGAPEAALVHAVHGQVTDDAVPAAAAAAAAGVLIVDHHHLLRLGC